MAMKKLKVDFGEIAIGMEDFSRDINEYYLDLETGEVLVISSDALRRVEDEEAGDDEGLSDWIKEDIDLAKNILFEDPERYAHIPEWSSYKGYNLMVEFAERVEDEGLREKLAIALDGKGAFRRFKNVLANYPEEEQRWFSFREKRIEEEVIDWLNSIGIEPVRKEG